MSHRVKLSRDITDFFKPFSQPRDTSTTQIVPGRELGIDRRKLTRPVDEERNQELEASADLGWSGARPEVGVADDLAGQCPNSNDRNTKTPNLVPLPQSPASKNERDYQDPRSSSLTPLESNSPSPVEEFEPILNKSGSFYSKVSSKADHSRSFGEDSFVSGSQRVMRNGEVVIANSDEDTDSQDSFEDLDELLKLPKQASKVSHSPPHSATTGMPYTLRSKRLTEKAGSNYSSGGYGANAGKISFTSRTTTKAPKFSLQMLVAQTAADQVVEKAAQQAEDSLRIVDDEAARCLGLQKSLFGDMGEEESVENVGLGNGDEDKKDRLIRAVYRSQLLQREKTWSFFDMSGSNLDQSAVAFPDCSIQGKWATQMQVPTLREQAFLSGFVAEIATRDMLPTEFSDWILDALCTENSQILRDAYVLTLGNAPDRTNALLSPEGITHLFRRIGASDEAIDLNIPIKARVQLPSARDVPPKLPEWSKIISVLELLKGVVNSTKKLPRTRTLLLLCRLALDSAAMRNGKVIILFEDLFADLLDSILPSAFEQELHELLAKISRTTKDPQLQTQLLRSIPTSRERASIFRHRLALAWFFQDDGYLALKPDRLRLFSKIRNRMEDSDLKIHPGADFRHLSTSIVFLDVAIGDGAPPLKSASSKSVIGEFNKDVDRLAVILRGMAADVNDTGSANLARAEAKDLLEAFLSRLAYTIRTKPKPRKDIFDSSKRLSKSNMKLNVGRMDDYLVKQPKEAEPGNIPNLELQDDNDSELLRYQWEQNLAKVL